MTLCCRPNSAISTMSVITASANRPAGPRSTVVGNDGEIADKADQIEEGREEDRIGDERKPMNSARMASTPLLRFVKGRP